MLTRLATLTSTGQITLPVAMRRRWGVGPGDRVTLVVRNRVLQVRPVRRSITEQTAGSLARFIAPEGREPEGQR